MAKLIARSLHIESVWIANERQSLKDIWAQGNNLSGGTTSVIGGELLLRWTCLWRIIGH